MTDLMKIDGIEPALAERMRRVGIRFVEDLLRRGATVAGRKEIAEKAMLDPVQLLRLVRGAEEAKRRERGAPRRDVLQVGGLRRRVAREAPMVD